MNYYVYILLDPRKPGKYHYSGLNASFLYEPYYVGKGKGYRINRHLTKFEQISPSRNNIKIGKINHIQSLGYDVLRYSVFYEKDVSEKFALKTEADLIKSIGRFNLKTGPLSNMTDGGEGRSGAISPNKSRTYEEIYGTKTAERIKKIKKEMILGSKNPMYGKPSPLRGKKLSQSAIDKIIENKRRPIKQLSLSGHLIRIWDRLVDAANYLNVHTGTIRHCLTPTEHNLTGGGFKWEYVDTPNLKYLLPRTKKNQKYYKVLNTRTSEVFYTTNLNLFGRQNNVSGSELSKTARNKINHAKGFKAVSITKEEYERDHPQ